jgi:nicotinamide riboside kinase
MMKVAIVGAFCTGKSTLFNKFREINTDWAYAPEAAREFFDANPVDLKDRLKLELQSQIQLKAKQYETEALLSQKNVLCDGSVITPAIYLKARNADSAAKKLIENYSDWFDTYSLFVLTSPEDMPYIRDDIWLENVETRLKMHEEYEAFIKSCHFNYIVVHGLIEERYRQLLLTLK